MISILIVDDHPVVRTGLRAVIESQGDFMVVGEASTGEEGVRRAALDEPDLVLMDLQMPGAEESSRLAGSLPSIPLLTS